MASAVVKAERKVLDARENVEKHSAAVKTAKKRLDDARAAKAKASKALTTARNQLQGIKKKKAAPKNNAGSAKRITAAKKKTAATPSTQVPNVCTVCHKAAVETPIAVLSCGCMFHQACIVRWASRGKDKCPTCLEPDTFEQFLGN
jgi:chromosome segregation ATPase